MVCSGEASTTRRIRQRQGFDEGEDSTTVRRVATVADSDRGLDTRLSYIMCVDYGHAKNDQCSWLAFNC
ncbi:hypothetical protein WN944_003176 [Citrus x changshan-huyou]|uniref:Uncharacterized protein n=1 Tax=Citrus x changshan-huyou TaxID=2935761 RepID=A0AAP0M2N9_9ROSI